MTFFKYSNHKPENRNRFFFQCFSAFIFIIFTFNQILFADTFITNTATANYSIAGTPNQSSSSVQFVKEATVSNQLTVVKQANKFTALKGDLINYTLVVRNASAIQNLVVKDSLPTGLSYVVGSIKLNNISIPNNQITYVGNHLDISLGDQVTNSVLIINYDALVDASAPFGVAINSVIATSDSQNSLQSQASVNIVKKTVAPPPATKAIKLTKQANHESVKIGELIRYTLLVDNINNKTIPEIIINDTLPAGLIFQQGSATLNNKKISGNISNGLSFKLGSIPANAQWKLSYDVYVSGAITSHTLVNQAQLISSDTKANSEIAKNSVEINNDILTISKQADKKKINIGDLVRYNVIINNPASHDLQNLVIKDTLPEGFIYQQGTAKINNKLVATNKVVLNGNLLQVSVESLKKGNSLSLSYQVRVSENTKSGFAINQVQANSTFAASATAEATVQVRTPSIINFLKIDPEGSDSIIPASSFNGSKNGGKLWQVVDSILLVNGEKLNLPDSQPLIKAERYSISEPVVIEVIDGDQNTDPTKKETIIVTITIPGTNDTETLLLTETSVDSGIFRGVLLTTAESPQPFNGKLSVVQGSKITVSYRDDEDQNDTSATAALITPNFPLILTKTADKNTASIGELIRYTLELKNTNNLNLPLVKIADTLPVGIKYVAGSVRVNNVSLNTHPTDTVDVQGRSLQFNLHNMPSDSLWKIEYLTKISANVQIGNAINEAFATSGSLISNIGRATIKIKDDLMRSENILTGRVYIGCNTDTVLKENVLKDARIYLETGRSVLSDSEGFWHLENVEQGSHVLQLDSESLPAGYEPLLCNNNTRQAGNAKSKFIDLQAGTLWQVDFHVKKVASSNEKTNSVSKIETNKEVNPITLYGTEYLKTAPTGFEILWPKNNYAPNVASTKIMVKSSPLQQIEVFLNGKKVSPLNYDGSKTNKERTITIKRWVGVDINIDEPNNTLLVIAKDKSGKEMARQTRNIHFSGEAASARYLEEESVLIADGGTIPVIAISVKDKQGYPLRSGMHGYFILENSQYLLKTQNDKQLADLNESTAVKQKYIIEEDGIARIKLNPTSLSGEVKLKLYFINKNNSIKTKNINAWIKPQLRKWILVGLAEGTIAHNTFSGNMKALKDLSKADRISKNGRVAFFAKGKIKGKYLLTVAYDTHKKNKTDQLELNRNTVDPDAWYTLYADNSSSQDEAPSSRKLYLKIEKDNFYALFGDFQTGMTTTTLANYERSLNGLKSGFKGERFKYNAFISETSNQHHHQEIPGDGTSGSYQLNNDIIVNSEAIKIETRDRFNNYKIIKTQSLTRYQDYDIDYDTGTLFFKFPISGRDQHFNPNIIVVDYDSEKNLNKNIIAGGRIAATSKNKKLEVGISALHLSRKDLADDSLIAIDANYKINASTRIRAEVAQSKSLSSDNQSVEAEILELEKQIANAEAKLFYRKQDKNFGIDNQGISQDGTKKIGVELRYKLTNKTEIKGDASKQKNLENNNTRQLLSATVTHHLKQAEISAGLRHSKEELNEKIIKNDTVLLGGRYTLNEGKVTLRTNLEKNLNSNDDETNSELSPDRIVVGIDVKVSQGITLFAENENTDNGKITTQNNRIGASASLWTGAKAKTTYTNEKTSQGQRNYATLGLSQQVTISENIKADFNIDHAKTLSSKNINKEKFKVNEPSIQGSQQDDYTAFSVGLGSNNKDWSWTTRAEIRDGKREDKLNFRAGLIHRLTDGKQVSGKISFTQSEHENGDNDKAIKISLSTAWHPKEKDFIFLSRLDLIDDNKVQKSTSSKTQKIIHNLHYNRKINNKTQISVHHGIKHVIDKNKENKHSTTIDTGTVEVRHDINKKWDIGVYGGYLRDWKEDATETLVGASIGLTPAKDMWLSIGYNFQGFNDDDFDGNSYKRKGPYLSFRYKFDQDSLTTDKKVEDRPSSTKFKEQ